MTFKISFALLLLFPALSHADPQKLKYECEAMVGQDWFSKKHDPSVYARTDKFTMNAEANVIRLTNNSFTNFDTEEVSVSDGDGKSHKTRGLSTFKGSSLGNGFALTVSLVGNDDEVGLEAMLALSTAKKYSIRNLIKGRRAMAVVFNSRTPRNLPEELYLNGSIYLSDDTNKTGPILVSINCVNLLTNEDKPEVKDDDVEDAKAKEQPAHEEKPAAPKASGSKRAK